MNAIKASEKRRRIVEQPWVDNFKRSSLHIGFRLSLTRAMCEFLSAVADDVQWNRCSLGSARADPDNWIATGTSLAARGLIEEKSKSETYSQIDQGNARNNFYMWSHWRLTPAGEHVVELIKLAGIYMKSDTAILKEVRGRNNP